MGGSGKVSLEEGFALENREDCLLSYHFHGENLSLFVTVQGTESEPIYRYYKRQIFALNEEKLSC